VSVTFVTTIENNSLIVLYSCNKLSKALYRPVKACLTPA
jgi:hypothetical protein